MKKIFAIGVLVLFACSFIPPKHLSWVAIGDSITYLNDHQNETGNRVTKGYMTRVVEKLPNLQFTNQGHNGWTACRIADSVERLGFTKADIYTVFLGTNDWWQGKRVGVFSDYEQNSGSATVFGAFRIIINKIRALNPGAKIILITPMQRADFVYINNMKNNAWGSYKEKNGQLLSQVAEAISRIAKYEHVELVDLYNEKGMGLPNLVKFKRLKNPGTNSYRNYPYPDFMDIPFNPETDEYPYPLEAIDVTYDGLHPSDKGYTIIADKLVKIMKHYK
jgi:lysophospholipase L1-like esterase